MYQNISEKYFILKHEIKNYHKNFNELPKILKKI